jgi:hypothetical protein
MEKTGLTYRGERRWRDVDVVWYAADRDNWVRSHLAAALGT